MRPTPLHPAPPGADPFERFFAPLPTPREMNAWDAECIRTFRIPEFTLMENAAREAFHVVRERLSPGSRVLVVAGGGNNGGDGFALARHLADAGHFPLAWHTKAIGTLRGTARAHARLARRTGVPFLRVTPESGGLRIPAYWRGHLLRPDAVIDALLGTGFSGRARALELALIRHITMLADTSPVYSLDIPSGLNGLDGRPAPEAVRAAACVTFEAAKPGLCLPEAAPYVGELHVRPIGMPRSLRVSHPASFRLFTPGPGALPAPEPALHKGGAGRVLVIGGSAHYAGAPVLAGLGALRGGAGLVTVAAPGEVLEDVRGAFPEIMALPLGDDEAWARGLLPELLAAVDAMQGRGALVLGPGIGRSEGALAVVETVLSRAGRPPVVLDADGLYPLGKAVPGAEKRLALLREDDIITPHPGEAGQILGTSADAVQKDRPAALAALCRLSPASVILKGAGSLAGQGDEPVTLIPIAAPALAVGGSGDVLSGLAAALLAGSVAGCIAGNTAGLMAACFAAHIHGRAGVLLGEARPARGSLAREIADMLPYAKAELLLAPGAL